MQIKKRVLCPERLRKVPAQFSWVDQRLVRQRYVHGCDPAALALYLVAYQKPLYQVLGLEEPPPSAAPPPRAGQCLSLKAVLQQILEPGGQP